SAPTAHHRFFRYHGRSALACARAAFAAALASFRDAGGGGAYGPGPWAVQSCCGAPCGGAPWGSWVLIACPLLYLSAAVCEVRRGCDAADRRPGVGPSPRAAAPRAILRACWVSRTRGARRRVGAASRRSSPLRWGRGAWTPTG